MKSKQLQDALNSQLKPTKRVSVRYDINAKYYVVGMRNGFEYLILLPSVFSRPDFEQYVAKLAKMIEESTK